MVQILVVEDEKIERETLVSILRQQLRDCEQVFEAKNGKEAIKLYEQYHPNIVCADINMPGINGLDMIRKMKEYNDTTEFLILSSYNYFEYAQEAIRLGVVDFILKPYNIPDFMKAMRGIVEKLRDNKQSQIDGIDRKQEELKSQLTHDCLLSILCEDSEIDLHRKLQRIAINIQSGFCMLAQGDSKDALSTAISLLKPQPQLILQEELHGLFFCFILYDEVFTNVDINALYESLESALQQDKNIGVGTFMNEIVKFHESYQIAQDYLDMNTPLPEQLDGSLTKQKNDFLNIADMVSSFIETFERIDEETLKVQIHKLAIVLVLKDKADILKYMNEFYATIMREVKVHQPDVDLENYYVLPLSLTTHYAQEVELNLNLNLKKLYRKVSEVRFKNTNHLVKEALLYIDQNYQKQVTLSNVAAHLKVSPFYISKLLSNSLHQTFTELLAIKRVEASKELLKKDERMKVIASKVGFQGQSYFNKIFKKYTGMTPKAYRNAMKE